MENDEKEPKLIDTAINACQSNIERHFWASIFELIIVAGIIFIVSYTLIKLAELQGIENDSKRQKYESNIRALGDKYLNAQNIVTKIRSEVKKVQDRMSKEKNNPNVKFELDMFNKPLESYIDDEKEAQTDYQKARNEYENYKSTPIVTDAMLYASGVILVVLIGVFTGLYRFHLREIAKNEYYKFGLLRVRIAANNATRSGFDGEVRTTLVKGAFDMPTEDSILSRRKKIESPLPGHPTSDLATGLLNRLLEEVDVILQPKAKS